MKLNKRIRVFWILKDAFRPWTAWKLAKHMDEQHAHALLDGAYL